MRPGTDYRGNMDYSDIFSAFGDIFGGGFGGSIFDDMFSSQRGTGRRRSATSPGSDLKVRLKLTVEEIATGVEKKLKIKKWKTCETCRGSGARGGSSTVACPACNGAGEIRQVSRSVFGQFVNIVTCSNCGGEGRVIKEPCVACKGDGRVQGEATIKVTIPAGVSEGNYIPLRGEGNVGKRGGPAGDIIVVIEEENHEFFTRNGDDVVIDLMVSFPEAALGADVEVPTLYGRSRLKIEPGTQSGTILRMREKGIPHLNGFGRGDQLVRLSIWVPRTVSSQDRTLLREMSKHENFSPSAHADGAQGEEGFLRRVKKALS
jgi:molecular chaperone DnaJ